MKFDIMDVQDRLKNFRELTGLTQSEFANRIGTDQSTITKWETGKARPGQKYLQKIHEIHGVSLDWLVSGQGEPFPDKVKLSGDDQEGEGGRLGRGDEGQYEVLLNGKMRVSDALVAASRVLDSGTSYATALYLNIQHFDRAIQAETRIDVLVKENKELKQRTFDLESKCDSLMKRLEALEARLAVPPMQHAQAAVANG